MLPNQLALFYRFLVITMLGHVVLLRERRLGFRHVDHWHQPTEEKEEREEETERPDQHGNIDPGGREVRPCTGQIISRQTRHNNHESLEPHADVHEDTDPPDDPRCRPQLLEPEQLRTDHVTGDHRPISPPVGPESTVGESKLFFLHLAVPGNEKLSSIRKPDD